MSLPPGLRVGLYEIVAPLGAGGMGQVYRARDTKLGRDVALKVLPPLFALDPDRLARFRREAQVLASLNHPNIGHIYGFEETGTTRALVLELVDGPTLADRIAHGPIPLAEALPIARQIADALETAHELGIIHRDLKPANIKVREDGTVKVLDFGLAKALAPDAASAGDQLTSPTMTSPAMTGMGMIMGTAAYMSPEQAKGRSVDRRADIWAFGVVLFEMLTARPLFTGDSVAETIGFVATRDPDWSKLPPATPPVVRQLLRRCLERDPKARLRDIGEARLQLAEPATAIGIAPAADTPLPPSRSRDTIAWAVAAVAVIAALAMGVMRWRSAPAVETPESRLEIVTPPTPDPVSIAVSYDGRSIVFVAQTQSQTRLWVRPLSTGVAQPITGTEGATLPFWSPNGQSIGFFADGKLKRVDLNGVPETLTNAPSPRGGAWSADDEMVFAPNANSPLYRIPANGGTPVPVTTLAGGHLNHRFPKFLADGRHFIFYAQGSSTNERGVYIQALGDASAHHLTDADAAAVAVGNDIVVFMRQGAIFAQRLDSTSTKLVGAPVRLADDVSLDGPISASAIAAGGSTIAYRTGQSVGLRRLAWFDRTGKLLGAIGEPDTSGPRTPEISPDGRSVAFFRTIDGNPDIWLVDIVSGIKSRFTFDSAGDVMPIWSHDGKRVIFSSNRKGSYDLYERAIAENATEVPLFASDKNKIALQASPDGKYVLYRMTTPDGYDLWAQPTAKDGQPVAVATTPFVERDGQFSPDGKWIAFQSNESGKFEIYVQPFPGPGAKRPVSAAGGAQARWRHDGKELYYIGLDNRLMAVPMDLSTPGTFTNGPPAPLFTPRLGGGPVPGSDKHNYAVARDGRFLAIVRPDEDTTSPITVILNWRLPVAK